MSLATALAPLVSCSPEQRDRAMHFFFEIPEPEQLAAGDAPTGRASMGKREDAGPTTLPAEAGPGRYNHPLPPDVGCGGCHNSKRGQRLLAPITELCQRCHANLTEDRAYIHGPVALGECRLCHRPHDAPVARLLIAPVRPLCRGCHVDQPAHRSVTLRDMMSWDCTGCHNPHAGENARFLIKPEAVTETARRSRPE